MKLGRVGVHLALLGLAWPITIARAGEIQIQERVYPATSNWPSGLTEEPKALSGVVVTRKPGIPSSWLWRLRNTSTLYVTVRMATASNNIPAGFEFFDYVFRLPFTLESKVMPYTAVVARQSHSASFARAFVADAQATRGAAWNTDNLTILLHRARIIFRGRLEDMEISERSPKKLDIRIAYWLLLTTQELYRKRFILGDSLTETTRIWLTRQVTQHPNLFDRSTVSADEAKKLVENTSLLKMERDLVDHLVKEIEFELWSRKHAAKGCALVRALWRELDQKPPDEFAELTNKGALGIRTLRGVASCIVKEIERAGADANALKEEGVQILARLHKSASKLRPERKKKLQIDESMNSLRAALSKAAQRGIITVPTN